MKLSPRYIFSLLVIATLCGRFVPQTWAQPTAEHNLKFTRIPAQWDRGLPLGNGMCGVLVWQKEGKLRLSVDRADLWDLRPMAEIDKYTYAWAYQHRLSRDWDTVWKVADEPYDRDAAPTKLPGAAVEFDISRMGEVVAAELDLATAMCTIRWKSGMVFRAFVDATQPLVRYSWRNTALVPIPDAVPRASLVAPPYGAPTDTSTKNAVVGGQDLSRLGYARGTMSTQKNVTIYDQPGWGTFSYQAALASIGSGLTSQGIVSISSHRSDKPKLPTASELVAQASGISFDDASVAHKVWWKQFWSKASIVLPDKQLESQWYREVYKFGAASRTGAPPISLQAIWTADNGKLPPWKGDFHSDLNTQLSYWPAYSGNHLEEGAVFTDWLWEHRSEFSAYARRVFGADGLNVPGVATLDGQPMGGWHMYAMSPTVASWLAQNFYLQWRYSMDRDFLLKRAYPWVSDAARFIEQVTKVGADGTRALPMSSSPEFNDGGIEAWFLEMTNYDRALCRYVFRTAAELAGEAGKAEEQSHWLMREKEISPFDIDAETGLTIAKNVPYVKSHRHFSHLMAIHPLGLLNYDAPADRRVIETSVANLEKNGSSEWKGYSFSWLGNIYARMHQGEKAADALRTFARCYCSENSFHLNEDLCKRRPDQSTHLPFTLEGNFAFASGIQEMLLQSHAGYIDVFPALPRTWTDVAFTRLRAEGAILVSAVQRSGETVSVALESERGGEARIKLPFTKYTITDIKKAKAGTAADGFLTIVFEPGGTAELSRAAQ